MGKAIHQPRNWSSPNLRCPIVDDFHTSCLRETFEYPSATELVIAKSSYFQTDFVCDTVSEWRIKMQDNPTPRKVVPYIAINIPTRY